MNATLGKVAEHAGVARDTARKVLLGDPSVRPYIREAVQKAIKELDYHPNQVARALRGKNMRLVPISVHALNEFYFGNLAWHLSKSLVMRGMEPTLCFDSEHLLRMSRSFSTSGSIRVGWIGDENLCELRRQQPVVTIDAHSSAAKGTGNVGINFAKAYRRLTRAALARGKRRFAIVSAHYVECLKRGWEVKKFSHVFDVLRERGLGAAEPSGANVFGCAAELDAWMDAQSAGAVGAAQSAGAVDAVFCENDLVAAQVSMKLAARGLRLPEDVLVAGCDANCRVHGAWSVRLDAESIAIAAVELLCQLIDGGKAAAANPVYTPDVIDENGDVVPEPKA